MYNPWKCPVFWSCIIATALGMSCCTYSLVVSRNDSKIEFKASTYPETIIVTPQK